MCVWCVVCVCVCVCGVWCTHPPTHKHPPTPTHMRTAHTRTATPTHTHAPTWTMSGPPVYPAIHFTVHEQGENTVPAVPHTSHTHTHNHTHPYTPTYKHTRTHTHTHRLLPGLCRARPCTQQCTSQYRSCRRALSLLSHRLTCRLGPSGACMWGWGCRV